jgi:hypothetical protein
MPLYLLGGAERLPRPGSRKSASTTGDASNPTLGIRTMTQEPTILRDGARFVVIGDSKPDVFPSLQWESFNTAGPTWRELFVVLLGTAMMLFAALSRG